MTRPPLVSVILPVYNGLPHLANSVESVLKQTWTDWELVVVNDGSNDGSEEFLQALCSKDHRVRYVAHGENKGVASAYNSGVQNALGRFLAFQEQDDISLPHRLETELRILREYNAPFVSSRVAWMDETGEVYKFWPDDILGQVEVWGSSESLYYRLLIHQTRIANTTTMIDRTLMAADDLVFDEHFRRSGQDWDLHLRLVEKYSSIRLAEPLVLFRRHRGHVSSTTSKRSVFRDNRRLIAKHLRSHWDRHHNLRKMVPFLRAGSNELLLEARYYRRLTGLVLGGVGLLLWPDNPGIWRSIWNLFRRPAGVGHA